MKYLKTINELNKEYNPYESIFRDLRSIFNKNMNYIDEPTMSYKELYNLILSIKHRSEEILENIKKGKDLWWVSSKESIDDIEDELSEISEYCYEFTRSKRSLEELKDLI